MKNLRGAHAIVTGAPQASGPTGRRPRSHYVKAG